MEKRKPSIIKHENRIPLQEVEFPDFPDEDTVTTTVTKSRRVSFGGNFVKEFLVGSAVSTQFVSEYEQPFLSSDSSNANSSRSGILDESALNLCVNKSALDDSYTPVRKKYSSDKHPYDINDRNNDENWDFSMNNMSNTFSDGNLNGSGKTESSRNTTKLNKKPNQNDSSYMMLDKQVQNKKNDPDMNYSKLNETNKNSKQGKFSSTICFSADSPTADMEFTEGCISLAKSIFEKKKKEMTVYIQAKARENMREEKAPNDTIHFEASAVEMSLTKCVQDMSEMDDTTDNDMCLTRCVDEKTNCSANLSNYGNKGFPLSLNSNVTDESEDDAEDDIENVPPETYLLKALLGQGNDSEDDAELERSLFFPKRSLSEILKSDPLKTSMLDEMEECDMDMSAVGPTKFATASDLSPKGGIEEVMESEGKGPSDCNTSTSTESNMDLSLPVGRTLSPEFVAVESSHCHELSVTPCEGIETCPKIDTTHSSDLDMDLSAVVSSRILQGPEANQSNKIPSPNFNQTVTIERNPELPMEEKANTAESLEEKMNLSGGVSKRISYNNNTYNLERSSSNIDKTFTVQEKDVPSPSHEMLFPKLNSSVYMDPCTDISAVVGAKGDATYSKDLSLKMNGTIPLEKNIVEAEEMTLELNVRVSPDVSDFMSSKFELQFDESRVLSPKFEETATLEKHMVITPGTMEHVQEQEVNTTTSLPGCKMGVSAVIDARVLESPRDITITKELSKSSHELSFEMQMEDAEEVMPQLNATVSSGLPESVFGGQKDSPTKENEISTFRENGECFNNIELELDMSGNSGHKMNLTGAAVAEPSPRCDIKGSSTVVNESLTSEKAMEEVSQKDGSVSVTGLNVTVSRELSEHTGNSHRNTPENVNKLSSSKENGECFDQVQQELNLMGPSECNLDLSSVAPTGISPASDVKESSPVVNGSLPLKTTIEEVSPKHVSVAMQELNATVSSECDINLSATVNNDKDTPEKLNEMPTFGDNGDCVNVFQPQLNMTGNSVRNTDVSGISPKCDVKGASFADSECKPAETAVEMSSEHNVVSVPELDVAVSSECNIKLSAFVNDEDTSEKDSKASSSKEEGVCVNEVEQELNMLGTSPRCDIKGSPSVNESVSSERAMAEVSQMQGSVSLPELNVTVSRDQSSDQAISHHQNTPENVNEKSSLEEDGECIDQVHQELSVTGHSGCSMDLSGISSRCVMKERTHTVNESIPLERKIEKLPKDCQKLMPEPDASQPTESNMEPSSVVGSAEANEKIFPKVCQLYEEADVNAKESSEFNGVDGDRNASTASDMIGFSPKLNDENNRKQTTENNMDTSLVRNSEETPLVHSRGVQSKEYGKRLPWTNIECAGTPVRSRRSLSQRNKNTPRTGSLENDGEARMSNDCDASFQDRRKRARPFTANIMDSDMKPRHKEKRIIKSFTDYDMNLTTAIASSTRIHTDQNMDVSMDSIRDLFSASELFPSVSDQDSEEDETSLGDKNIMHVLREQSEEANCCWRMEDTVQEDSSRIWTFIFPLMDTAARVEFNLKPATNRSLFSFSTVLSRSVHLAQTGEPRDGMPHHHLEKKKATVDFGYDRVKSYVKKGTRDLDTVKNMPLFVDQLNSFVTKLNLVLKQVEKILKEYPGSRLNKSVLTFRLYSFPLMFSCAIALDLREPVHMTDDSIAVKFHFGNFNLTEIKSVFSQCLGRDDALIHFIKSLTDSVVVLEGEGGFITNRSHIRLLT